MIQKHRISTNIGIDQKIVVELKQEYDLLEILSLRFSQKDIYASFCSDYGVVVGRITANNGLGIPNAKVSIFVPQEEIDSDDPVISALYPYVELSDKNEDGYRYNLLPAQKQHDGHTPTGTFPDQTDVLDREEVLEVYEKYYNYTVKTNDSGDFMIWGVPLGSQRIHVDIDLSDIGCFSLRPYDFIKKGVAEDNFERFYKFKSSTDIDGLPQIVSFDKTIEVYPFWGNKNLCEIGITRTDFDLSEAGIEIEPMSLLLLSSFTDDNSDAIKRNGKIRARSGYKCNLQTTAGTIECVRYTGKKVIGSDGVSEYPELEYLALTEVIDEDGVAMVVLPMNMDYVYTNEFGEQEITKDSNKGVPTTTIARFRFGLTFQDRKKATAKYLVPNIREFNPDITRGMNTRFEYSMGMLATYQFSDVFEDYLKVLPPTTAVTFDTTNYTQETLNHKKDLMLGTNNDGIPEDYFYKFTYGKVYSVSSFQGTHFQSPIQIPSILGLVSPAVLAVNAITTRRSKDAFLGVKQIRPSENQDCASRVNYFPTNFAFRNRFDFNLLLAQVILFLQFVFTIINVKFAEFVGRFFYSVSDFFYNIYFGWPFKWRPFERFSEQLKDFGYKIQDRNTKTLSLTIYPDCEECTSDDNSISTDSSFVNDYCRVGEVKLKVDNYVVGSNKYVLLYIKNSDSAVNFSSSITDATTLLPELFPNESSKSNEGLCSTGSTISYSELDNLHNQTITIPNDTNTSKYYALVYPKTSGNSTSFTEFLTFFNDGSNTIDSKFIIDNGVGLMTSLGLGPGKYIQFTYDEWNEITGINYDEGTIDDTNTFAVLRIYDRSSLISEQTPEEIINIEQGCQKYDSVFDESLIKTYLWGLTTDYGSPTDPLNPPTYSNGYEESLTKPINKTLVSSIIGRRNTQRLPYKISWKKIGNTTYDRRTKSGLSEFRDGVFTIIPVIVGTSRNSQAIKEWYNRKRINLFFCGGVINYSFIDNWLTGALYFFKFDKKIKWDNQNQFDLSQRASKFPRELVFYNITDDNFYYRSTPYKFTNGVGEFIGQQLLKINNQYQKQILHPTTFYDLGVRDEFFAQICTDVSIDPTCSVVRDISVTSYQDPANIIEHALNYRLDAANAKLKVEEFFSGTQYGSTIKVLDGDIIQLMSINCEAGIEGFDLDSPHYFIYNNEYMDPESPQFKSYFQKNNAFGPLPIDFKLDDNGVFVRGCLNYRLGDFSQKVPFYLWDKGDTGFGKYGASSDIQKWDRQNIATMKLQRIYSISSINSATTNYLMADGEEEYLLKPMTIDHPTYAINGNFEDMLERFEVISNIAPNTGINEATSNVEGDLWLHVLTFNGSDYRKNPLTGDIYVVVNKTWVKQPQGYASTQYETFLFQTKLNYSGSKQVLSTPFLFYFGLKPEKTAFDTFIKYFGPKDAFTNNQE
jgi:hypothetical protein